MKHSMDHRGKGRGPRQCTQKTQNAAGKCGLKRFKCLISGTVCSKCGRNTELLVRSTLLSVVFLTLDLWSETCSVHEHILRRTQGPATAPPQATHFPLRSPESPRSDFQQQPGEWQSESAKAPCRRCLPVESRLLTHCCDSKKALPTIDIHVLPRRAPGEATEKSECLWC